MIYRNSRTVQARTVRDFFLIAGLAQVVRASHCQCEGCGVEIHIPLKFVEYIRNQLPFSTRNAIIAQRFSASGLRPEDVVSTTTYRSLYISRNARVDDWDGLQNHLKFFSHRGSNPLFCAKKNLRAFNFEVSYIKHLRCSSHQS